MAELHIVQDVRVYWDMENAIKVVCSNVENVLQTSYQELSWWLISEV